MSKINKLLGLLEENASFQLMPDNYERKYGTSLRGEFNTSYRELEAAFGTPNGIDALIGEREEQSSGNKVSSEWAFLSDDGSEFSLYDYKETDIYDEDLPTVEEFRSEPSYDWHIGASGKIDEFVSWLKEQIK